MSKNLLIILVKAVKIYQEISRNMTTQKQDKNELHNKIKQISHSTYKLNYKNKKIVIVYDKNQIKGTRICQTLISQSRLPL